MMHLFVNVLAASAGSGITYIRNVLPRLARRTDVRTTVLIGADFRGEIAETPTLSVLAADAPASAGMRFWYEQTRLPQMIRDCGADVLLSAGNFALFRSPVPQLLLSGNGLYTSPNFMRDLRARSEYRMMLENSIRGRFARWSARAADCTIAPSTAFAGEIRKWTSKPVRSIHHGFDHQTFCTDSSPLAETVEAKLAACDGALRLLSVTHYNYFRNFETLFRAVAILKEHLSPRAVRLFLTCSLRTEENPGAYRAESAAALVRELNIQNEIVELGAVPYQSLHRLYRSCDLYLTAAYVETFAHPLIEAMASGLPVIASDLPVHREICGAAAEFFPCFSPEKLAESILHLAPPKERLNAMREQGLSRSQDFSWDRHLDEILRVAVGLVSQQKLSKHQQMI